MPITRSAKKALRQSQRRHERNLLKKEAYKDAIKKIKKAVGGSNSKDIQNLLSQLFRALDKAAKTHVIKKGKADRLKSRISRLVATSKK